MAAELRVVRLEEASAHSDEAETDPNADTVLIRRSKTGDTGAFAKLYERYRKHIYAICLQRVRDPEFAEDVVQDTFIRAYTSLDRFEDGRKLLPWLSSIAVRRCIDLQRHGSRSFSTDPSHHLLSGSVGGEGPLDQVLVSERRDRLREELSKLPERQRRALLLHALEGWNYVDIASAERTSLLSVKSLIWRARENLRNAYETGVLGALVFPLRRLRVRAAARAREAFAADSSSVLFSAAQPFSVALATFGLAFAAPAVPLLPQMPGVTSMASANVQSETRSAEMNGASASALPGSASRANRDTRASDDRKPDRATPDDALDIARNVAQPNENVHQPEDAAITSVVFSPDFDRDRTILAAGTAPCWAACFSVLFRSTDAGASWSRLPAEGFDGKQLVLPPGYPDTDGRIFAMGPLGLSVSEDDGASFRQAVPFASGFTGAPAISPLFNKGDPKILIGAENAPMQYDDTLGTYTSTSYVLAGKRLNPVFSPGYEHDDLLLAGSTHNDPLRGRLSSVLRCVESACSETVLEPGGIPTVRPAADFVASGRTYAFNGDSVFVSSDAGSSFVTLRTPWNGAGSVQDILPLPASPRLLAAVIGGAAEIGGVSPAGLYASPDGGASWERSTNALFAQGARVVSATGNRVVAGLSNGVACSTDGGGAWHARCPAP